MTVSKYNEQALASTALIQKGIREQVEVLKRELPKQDNIIQIGVVSETDSARVHEVATLHFDYSDKTSIKFKAAVYKEEEVLHTGSKIGHLPQVRDPKHLGLRLLVMVR